jgi:FtsZ-interacting cell division protein YlmF
LRCPQRSRRAGRQRRPLTGDLAAGGFHQLLAIDPRELEEAERVMAAVSSSQTVVLNTSQASDAVAQRLIDGLCV